MADPSLALGMAFERLVPRRIQCRFKQRHWILARAPDMRAVRRGYDKLGRDDGERSRAGYDRGGYLALGFAFHSPSIAPVGSTMIESQPMSITSVTSFITLPPSDFAFLVEASMSSTRT